MQLEQQQHEERIGALEQTVKEHTQMLQEARADVAAMRRDLSEMLAILRASKFGADLIKWLATVGGAVVGMWLIIREHVR